MAWLSWHNLLVLSGAICVSGRPVVCWYAYHILTLAGNNQSHVDVQFSRCWFVSLEFSLSILLFCGPLLDFLPTIFLFFRTWPRSWPRPVTQLLLKVFFFGVRCFPGVFPLAPFYPGQQKSVQKIVYPWFMARNLCLRGNAAAAAVSPLHLVPKHFSPSSCQIC